MSRGVAVLCLLVALTAPVTARAWSKDPATPEGWAWTKIQAGDFADFGDRCKRMLDPRQATGWDDPCRQIPAQFLIDILTISKFETLVGRHGVDLRGAHIVGDLGLSDADISPQILLRGSRIDGNLDLGSTHLHRLLSLSGSALGGTLSAMRLNAENDIILDGQASFSGDVMLSAATIGGYLIMTSATFNGRLDADGVNVHRSLYMRDNAYFGEAVSLEAAEIDGTVDMDAAIFAKNLDARNLDVRGNLLMSDFAYFFGDVTLIDAKVGTILDMDTASFAGGMNANSLDVKGDFYMRDNASFDRDVNLIGAKIGGVLDMNRATLSGALLADSLDVKGALYMRQASFAGDVQLILAKVGLLTMASSTATNVDLSDLSGATGSELEMDGLRWRCRPGTTYVPTSAPFDVPTLDNPSIWTLGDPSSQIPRCSGPRYSWPKLILRNVHVDILQDSVDAWPPTVDLEGLHYDRLGGANATPDTDMRSRLIEQWTDWLGRNSTYSSQPYTQLASVLIAAGRREMAEAVLFAGHERERSDIWTRRDVGSWRWLTHDFPSWLWLTFFGLVAGYGIGLYTFRVLWWVIGLTVLGTLLLSLSPYAKERSLSWRLGASLHRLLPIVELNKEFKDFFDNTHEPDKPLKLHPWQMAFFAGVALAGWVLGFFLLAAMGGLTQK